MKKFNQRGLLASAIVLSLWGAQSFAKEYLVKLKDFNPAMIQSQLGIRVLETHEAGRLVKIDIDEKSSKLTEIKADPDVEYVVPNFKLHSFEARPDFVKLREQWALQKVNIEKAWSLSGHKGISKVVVAVIDTGVDYNHESLKENMVPGYDFKDNDSDPQDIVGQNPGHGTHCAGVVGASGKIENGISGAVQEVSVMPIRFLGADGSGDLMAGIKSIDFAIEKGAKIISASWGATVSRANAQALIEAVERASKAGVIFVAAAGNERSNNDSRDTFPANAVYENTISVAASGNTDAKPTWSNFGKSLVHIASPGENIISTIPGNKYSNLSGTSMATPLISGIAALLLSQDPGLTGSEIRALLQTTGAKVAIETACDCRVDAGAAMEHLIQKKAWLVPAAHSFKANETVQVQAKNLVAPLNYQSADPSVLSVDANGVVKALKVGETTINVSDAKGQKAQSLTFRVINQSNSDPGNPGNPGTPPGLDKCPIEDEAMCKIMCQLNPEFPWCKK